MKKINIIRKTQEFEKIIKYRHQYSNRFFAVYIIKREEKYYRFGISIPKKTGNAVLRNKLKRQVKNIIDNNELINKDYDYVIIVRREIMNLDFLQMTHYLNLLLSKIGDDCENEKS